MENLLNLLKADDIFAEEELQKKALNDLYNGLSQKGTQEQVKESNQDDVTPINVNGKNNYLQFKLKQFSFVNLQIYQKEITDKNGILFREKYISINRKKIRESQSQLLNRLIEELEEKLSDFPTNLTENLSGLSTDFKMHNVAIIKFNEKVNEQLLGLYVNYIYRIHQIEYTSVVSFSVHLNEKEQFENFTKYVSEEMGQGYFNSELQKNKNIRGFEIIKELLKRETDSEGWELNVNELLERPVYLTLNDTTNILRWGFIYFKHDPNYVFHEHDYRNQIVFFVTLKNSNWYPEWSEFISATHWVASSILHCLEFSKTSRPTIRKAEIYKKNQHNDDVIKLIDAGMKAIDQSTGSLNELLKRIGFLQGNDANHASLLIKPRCIIVGPDIQKIIHPSWNVYFGSQLGELDGVMDMRTASEDISLYKTVGLSSLYILDKAFNSQRDVRIDPVQMSDQFNQFSNQFYINSLPQFEHSEMVELWLEYDRVYHTEKTYRSVEEKIKRNLESVMNRNIEKLTEKTIRATFFAAFFASIAGSIFTIYSTSNHPTFVFQLQSRLVLLSIVLVAIVALYGLIYGYFKKRDFGPKNITLKWESE